MNRKFFLACAISAATLVSCNNTETSNNEEPVIGTDGMIELNCTAEVLSGSATKVQINPAGDAEIRWDTYEPLSGINYPNGAIYDLEGETARPYPSDDTRVSSTITGSVPVVGTKVNFYSSSPRMAKLGTPGAVLELIDKDTTFTAAYPGAAIPEFTASFDPETEGGRYVKINFKNEHTFNINGEISLDESIAESYTMFGNNQPFLSVGMRNVVVSNEPLKEKMSFYPMNVLTSLNVAPFAVGNDIGKYENLMFDKIYAEIDPIAAPFYNYIVFDMENFDNISNSGIADASQFVVYRDNHRELATTTINMVDNNNQPMAVSVYDRLHQHDGGIPEIAIPVFSSSCSGIGEGFTVTVRFSLNGVDQLVVSKVIPAADTIDDSNNIWKIGTHNTVNLEEGAEGVVYQFVQNAQ